ncbi:MAG: NAD(P)/FAD-dependent oxidoreductase [Nitrospirota bacterium]
MKKNVIIIGAGASGLICAIEAGKRGRSVIILDHSKRIGSKIRVSGGGRCNFTNMDMGHEHFISRNPDFCKSALARFTPHDFISMLTQYGIGYYEKEEGQLFCRKSSGEVVDMLYKEAKRTSAEIVLSCTIRTMGKKDRFIVSTDKGVYESESLVIATGGMSYPELGATDIGYRAAGQFGLKVTALKPALVPFKVSSKDIRVFGELSGISLRVEVSCNNISFKGDMLFTHHGMSGPAMLQISSYWDQGDEININLLPDFNVYDFFAEERQSRMEMRNLLSQFFPKRFADKWCELNFQSKPLYQYNDKELKAIEHRLNNWVIRPAGTEGYKKSEATLGGVDTDELSSKTMEAKKVPGLYFVGEVIDVTGHLGGYNLHWAWASGFSAGQYA